MTNYQRNQVLINARRRRGWTQAKVAFLAAVTRETYQRWEQGMWRPRPDHLRQLCQVFGVTAMELGYEVRREEEIEWRLCSLPEETSPLPERARAGKGKDAQ